MSSNEPTSSNGEDPNRPDGHGIWDTSSPEAFVDQAMLVSTQQRLGADRLRSAADEVDPDMFGHSGLASQFSALLGQLADTADAVADRTESGARHVWDVQQRAQHESGKDAADDQ